MWFKLLGDEKYLRAARREVGSIKKKKKRVETHKQANYSFVSPNTQQTVLRASFPLLVIKHFWAQKLSRIQTLAAPSIPTIVRGLFS